MTVTITIRSVPDAVRDELAARASRQGQSLQEYLSEQLRRLAATPSAVEAAARARLAAAGLPPLSGDDIAEAVRASRP